LPEIKAYAPGIYARSEELVQATRDLDSFWCERASAG
jgi:5-methyltetrahydropteroyltriglutamate--homocysteine methyltransferase